MSDETKTETAADRGRAWDYELARRIGGTRQKGSGNTVYAKLDARGQDVVVSGKHTDAASLRLTPEMIDEARRAVLGPESASAGTDSFIAVHFGPNLKGPALAVIDLDLLLRWISAPPEIVPASKQDSLRHTASVPPFLR